MWDTVHQSEEASDSVTVGSMFNVSTVWHLSQWGTCTLGGVQDAPWGAGRK
jgi:hypothetical protein